MHCRRLTEVSLPDTLVRIERRAFADCSNLKEIRIPSSVTEIAGDAFPEHTRIFADPGSYAHHWAEKRGRL
ncbi:MAG: leucine-rich repeat protein [Oscillospiraceae bacterium]|nr:leucine-rich repeat protein [Oscillospiraceae bacterium]